VDVVPEGVVCSNVPPVEADHHLKTPEPALVEVKATEPVPHLEAPVAEGAAGAEPALLVAITGVRELVQPPLLNSA
jgi:hypothetical protein